MLQNNTKAGREGQKDRSKKTVRAPTTVGSQETRTWDVLYVLLLNMFKFFHNKKFKRLGDGGERLYPKRKQTKKPVGH